MPKDRGGLKLSDIRWMRHDQTAMSLRIGFGKVQFVQLRLGCQLISKADAFSALPCLI